MTVQDIGTSRKRSSRRRSGPWLPGSSGWNCTTLTATWLMSSIPHSPTRGPTVYGGSFDNRIRFLLETFAAVRKVWPERLPLTVRLSVTDWIEGGVTLEDSIELVRRLKSAGLDLLDVSHGSITPDMSKVPWGPGL